MISLDPTPVDTDILLHVFATLPITTASNERSFSALKRLKSYLSQLRLNGLAMLHMRKDPWIVRQSTCSCVETGLWVL